MKDNIIHVLTCDTCEYCQGNRCKLGVVIKIDHNDSACYKHSALKIREELK